MGKAILTYIEETIHPLLLLLALGVTSEDDFNLFSSMLILSLDITMFITLYWNRVLNRGNFNTTYALDVVRFDAWVVETMEKEGMESKLDLFKRVAVEYFVLPEALRGARHEYITFLQLQGLCFLF